MSKAAAPEAEATEKGADAPAPKGASAMPALIVAIIVLPAVSFATTQFFLLPKLRGMITEEAVKTAAKGGGEKKEGAKKEGGHGAAKEGGHAAAKEGGHGGHGGKEGEGAGESTFDFENIVVNLAGSMGTRYLKTSFTVNGGEDIKAIMTENKKQLLDVTINVLSTRSLADLEAPGAKNIVRNDLMANLNQALKSDVVEQIYFTEFVIQ